MASTCCRMSSAWIVVNDVANFLYSPTTVSRSEKTSMLLALTGGIPRSTERVGLAQGSIHVKRRELSSRRRSPSPRPLSPMGVADGRDMVTELFGFSERQV